MINVVIFLVLCGVVIIAILSAILSFAAYQKSKGRTVAPEPRPEESAEIIRQANYTLPSDHDTLTGILKRYAKRTFGGHPLQILIITILTLGVFAIVGIVGPGYFAYSAELSWFGAWLSAPIMPPIFVPVTAIACTFLVLSAISGCLKNKIFFIGREPIVLSKKGRTAAPDGDGWLYSISKMPGSIPMLLLTNQTFEAPRSNTEHRWGERATLHVPDGYDHFMKTVSLPVLNLNLLYGPLRVAPVNGPSFADYVVELDPARIDRHSASLIVDELKHLGTRQKRLRSEVIDLQNSLRELSADAGEHMRHQLQPMIEQLAMINRTVGIGTESLAEMIRSVRIIAEKEAKREEQPPA